MSKRSESAMDERADTEGPFSLSAYSRLYPTCSPWDSQPSSEGADANVHWSSSAKHLSRLSLGGARGIFVLMDLDPKAPHETLQHSIEIISYDRSGGSES